MSAEAYGVGEVCTWHGPMTFATLQPGNDDEGSHVCPRCGLPVRYVRSEDFWWAGIRTAERANSLPNYEHMMRWSQGHCFPDFNTMQDAYRQAMTT